LIAKLDIIGNTLAMGNVCRVPLSYIFLRGQGVKIASLASYVCKKNGYLIPVLPKSDEDNLGYEGAIVLPPQTGIHFKPTVTLDFNSLYPSSMISENVSHDTSVEIGGKYDNLPGLTYVDVEYDDYEWRAIAGKKKMEKIKVGKTTCRYVQPQKATDTSLETGVGIIPKILMELLGARKKAKKMMESETDPFKAKLYNAMQLAYKTVANSVYGQTGAPTGLLFKPEIAASTTAIGRRMIIFSRDYVKTAYKHTVVTLSRPYTDDDDGNQTPFEGRRVLVRDSYCVYGDTDSVFVRFNMFDADTNVEIEGRDAIFISMALGKQVAREISNQLKKPQNLDFEKVITPFILFSKKRYCGHYYTKMNKDYYYLNSMGIVLKRRDNAPIVKHIYGGVIKKIMENRDIAGAYTFLQEECRKLLRGEFPMEMFTVSKTLKSFYKFPNRIAHNVLAMRQAQRDPGNKFSSNDRIPYVYIVPGRDTPKTGTGKSAKYKQGDIIEIPDFIIKNKLKINYPLYLTNQIQVPVSQIFLLERGYENIDRMFKLLIDDQEYANAGMKKAFTPGFAPVAQVQTFNSLTKLITAAKQRIHDAEIEIVDNQPNECGDGIGNEIDLDEDNDDDIFEEDVGIAECDGGGSGSGGGGGDGDDYYDGN
jgi:DNA polymerase elongation subunit (family B)